MGIKPHKNLLHNGKGFTFSLILVLLLVLSLSMGIAGTAWRNIKQRADEKELLWRGRQYRKAIGSYYMYTGANNPRTYPGELEELLTDNRALQPLHHIRHLYKDPMTGKNWRLLKNKQGLIIGVFSGSNLKPFKVDGFTDISEAGFSDRLSYSDWQFIYHPIGK